MTIKAKLILGFLSIAIIPLLIVELLSIYQAKNALEAAQIDKLEVVADLKVRKIETFFAEREADIIMAQKFFNIKSSLPILIRLLNNPSPPDYIAAKKRLDEQLQVFEKVKGYIDVMLVNPEGTIVYVTNERHGAKDLDHSLPDPDGRAFEEGKRGVYFTDIFVNDVEGIPFGMLVTAPVHDLQGRFIGVIALEVNIADSIYQLIQDTTGLGKTGETLIGTKVDGTALFLNPLRHVKNAAFNRKVTIGSESALPIQEAVLGRDGSGLSIDYRNEEVIAAWRYIPSLDWGMVAKIDKKEVFASITQQNRRVLALSGVILLLVTYLAIAVARSIARPLLALQKGMEIVGEGNLDYKVGTDASDEIGQLSRILDQMTENIGKISASRNALTQGIQQSIKSLQKEMVEREKAEEEARKSEARIHSIVETASDAIITIDERGVVETFNQAAERIFGYTEKEVIGRNISILMPSPHREKHDGYISKYLETGESKIIGTSRETVGQRKGGAVFPIDLSVSKVDLGDRLIFTGIVRDITKRKQAEEKLHSLNQEFLQVSRKAGMAEMATGLLHNVGNVLNSINVSVERIDEIIRTSRTAGLARAANLLSDHTDDLASFLADGEKGKHLTAYLTKLAKHLDGEQADTHDEIKSLTEAVDHVKNIISVQKEFIHSQDLLETVSIPALLDSVLRTHTMQPDYDTIQFIRDYSELPQISIRKHKVLQILINLVKNAAQALIRSDGKDKRMTIQASVIGEEAVQINIIDNGIGITSEGLSRIFSHGYTTKKDGHGFGLHSAALLAKELGGSLRVDSAGEGHGATFTLTLPLKSPDMKEGMSIQLRPVRR